MFIETTFMRYGHGKCGIIGLTLKPETLKIWGLGLYICSILEEDLADISSPEKKEGQEKHKEENKGRIESDAEDRENIRRKLELCIDLLDPTKHPQTIVNVATGQLAGETVNVDKTIELGTAAMKQFESKWPEGFDTKIF